MAVLSPVLRQRFFDSNGRPLAGGKLYSYVAGTTTPVATMADSSGTPNTNPVILDANGEANIWIGFGVYKFVLHDANNVPQWTVDNVAGSEDSEGGGSASGDLDGSYPGPTVVGIHGNPIIEPGETEGGFALIYNHAEGRMDWFRLATFSELENHINETTGAHAASAISVNNSGFEQLEATDVQGALGEVDGHIDDIGNPHSVTKSQVGLGNVSDDAQLKIASNLSDLNNAGTARTNLGLGNAAVENKESAVFNANAIQGYAVQDHAPQNGEALVWNASESRYEPSIVSSSGGGEGLKNFVQNPNAETNLDGWTLLRNTSDGDEPTPDDATGTVTGVLFEIEDTLPLAGSQSFKITKDAVNRQGHFVIGEVLPIDNYLIDKKLGMQFVYRSDLPEDTFIPYIWNETKQELVTPFARGGTSTIFQSHFHVEGNAGVADEYKITFHLASTTTEAGSLVYDEVVVNGDSILQTSFDTDWKEFAVVFDAITTSPSLSGSPTMNIAEWRREGSHLKVRWRYQGPSGEHTAGSGTYFVDLSSLLSQLGATVDTSLQDQGSSTSGRVGDIWVSSGTTNIHYGQAWVRNESTSYISFTIFNDTASGATWTNSSFALTSVSRIGVDLSIPIVEWRNQARPLISAKEALNQTLVLRRSTTAGQTIGTSVTAVNFPTHLSGNASAFDGTYFTAPETGTYVFPVSLRMSGVNLSSTQRLEGRVQNDDTGEFQLFDRVHGNGSSVAHTISGASTLFMNKGERAFVGAVSSVSGDLSTVGETCILSIYKIPDLSVYGMAWMNQLASMPEVLADYTQRSVDYSTDEYVPIVASGSNSDGEWIRYADGTQVVYKEVDFGSITANGSGTFSNPYRTASTSFTYPLPFSSGAVWYSGTPRRGTNTGSRTMSSLSGGSKTASALNNLQIVRISGDSNADNFTCHIVVYGRWK